MEYLAAEADERDEKIQRTEEQKKALKEKAIEIGESIVAIKKMIGQAMDRTVAEPLTHGAALIIQGINIGIKHLAEIELERRQQIEREVEDRKNRQENKGTSRRSVITSSRSRSRSRGRRGGKKRRTSRK